MPTNDQNRPTKRSAQSAAQTSQQPGRPHGPQRAAVQRPHVTTAAKDSGNTRIVGHAGGIDTGGVPFAGAASTAAAAANPTAASKKKHTGKIIGIVAVVLVVVAIVITCVVVFGNNDDFYDSNSLIGQAPYKTQEEIQAELDRIVEEGMLNISIASVIEFEDGQSEGVAYIENVPSNHYVMKVDIVLDDTGETVYESGGLKPDNYIEKIKLNRDLDAGTYDATATFHALDPDTLEEVGTAAAKVTLKVLN